MTSQEVFDFVVNHLRTQGEQSLSFDFGCAYRGPNGCKCAVGCLIPDKEYNKIIEGFPIDHLIDKVEEPYSVDLHHILGEQTKSLFKEHKALLKKLQKAHDDSENWIKTNGKLERLEQSFSKIAGEFNLKYNPS